MSRNRREHGRIISVETKTRGDALADDVAAGVTSITVEDAGDFDEDGGWLLIGGQVVEFTECDDDTGVITLAGTLDAAAEQGDPVSVWSELYDGVVEYQQALVELDGEYDNPDPVVAEVAEGVSDLPEGDRGRAGESCTLHRMADDEWEVVAVGGRPRWAQGGGARWEDDDAYILTASDITAGVAYPQLTRRPDVESVDAKWNGLGQEPTEFTVDYNTNIVTWPLSGFEKAGDRLQFHYTYRAGIFTSVVPDEPVPGDPAPDPADPANFFVPITGNVTYTNTGGGPTQADTYLDNPSGDAVWAPDNPGALVLGGWYTPDASFYGAGYGQAEYSPSLPPWQDTFKLYLLLRLSDIAFTHYSTPDYMLYPYTEEPEAMLLPTVALERSGSGSSAYPSATADQFVWEGWDAIQMDSGNPKYMYTGLKATSARTKLHVVARGGYELPVGNARETRQWTISEAAILVVTGG